MQLSSIDIVVMCAYLVGITVFGIVVGYRRNAGTQQYFLAGRSLGWFTVGAAVFTSNISTLHLVGRNGMHKYNNQDHSMLTAMTAVDNILDGVRSRDNLWALNTEQEYHEEKREDKPVEKPVSVNEEVAVS